MDDRIEYNRSGSNLESVLAWLGADYAGLDSDGQILICVDDGSQYTHARPGDTLTRDEHHNVVVTAFAR